MKSVNKLGIVLGAAILLFGTGAATASLADDTQADQYRADRTVQLREQIRQAQILLDNPNTPPSLRQEAANAKRQAEHELEDLNKTSSN